MFILISGPLTFVYVRTEYRFFGRFSPYYEALQIIFVSNTAYLWGSWFMTAFELYFVVVWQSV